MGGRLGARRCCDRPSGLCRLRLPGRRRGALPAQPDRALLDDHPDDFASSTNARADTASTHRGYFHGLTAYGQGWKWFIPQQVAVDTAGMDDRVEGLMDRILERI